jgi:hypothetical protein
MAKPKTEPTDVQKAFKTATEKYKKAKEAHEKHKTEASNVALLAATTGLRTAKINKNRESFLRVGNGRVGAAIASLNGLAKLASPASYEYSDEDVAKIKTLVGDAFKGAMTAFEMSKTKQAKGSAVKATFLQ